MLDEVKRSQRGNTHLLTREVDTHGTLTEQAGVKLVLITRNTRDDNIAKRCNVLQRSTLHLMDLMTVLLTSLATSKLLHPGDIDTVHTGAIIGQQRSKWAADNLRPVNNADSVTEQTVARRQDGVVDIEVFEDLDDGQRGTGQDRLLALGLGVQEADVLVHVEDVAVAKTLDIFVDVNNLLEVLVLAVVEDRVVDDDAIDVVVGVGR